MKSTESKVPTETYLLPGQQHCIGLPWERPGLSNQPPPPPAVAALAPSVNPFDKAELLADPCAGLEIGACQVIRRLSSNSASSLLAMRSDPKEGTALVALRKLELPDEGMQDLLEHAHWASHYRHPNLARVFGCEASEEGIFWVSEFASGATLAEVNATCRKIGKGVPAGLALAIAHETALALAELHVPGAHAHGFVSDESLFITFEGHSKLLDLGLFRCIAGKILRPEGLQAMAPYLSPEQVSAGRMPDPKTDVYSLAALLHECLSGQKLPNGFERHPHFPPVSSFNIALGKELDAVMARALDPDRAKRFKSADELAKALKSASSAFMWKPPQRAEFVSQLFQNRKRREQVLMAGCEEILWKPKRAPSLPKAPVAVSHPRIHQAIAPPTLHALPPPVPSRPTTSMRAAPASKKAQKHAKKAKAKASRARPLALALIASALALVWQQNLFERWLTPHEPRAVNAVSALSLAVAPLPEEAVAKAELSEEVAEQTLASARTVYAAQPKAKAAARKKRDEGPLPPWLQPRRRH